MKNRARAKIRQTVLPRLADLKAQVKTRALTKIRQMLVLSRLADLKAQAKTRAPTKITPPVLKGLNGKRGPAKTQALVKIAQLLSQGFVRVLVDSRDLTTTRALAKVTPPVLKARPSMRDPMKTQALANPKLPELADLKAQATTRALAKTKLLELAGSRDPTKTQALAKPDDSKAPTRIQALAIITLTLRLDFGELLANLPKGRRPMTLTLTD